MAPVSIALNTATLHIAGRLWPKGFDVVELAPEPEELMASLFAGERLRVWSGACDDTIFDDAEVNYAFRAWHDFHHFNADQPFNLMGERAVAVLQVRDLVALYGRTFEVRDMAALVLCEVIAQAEHIEALGTFVGSPGTETQRVFTERRWRHFVAMAANLVFYRFTDLPGLDAEGDPLEHYVID